MKLIKAILQFIAIVVGLLALPLLFVEGESRQQQTAGAGLPWQVEIQANGDSRVFGLTPGHSTLAEAKRLLSFEFVTALIAAPGEALSLEAFAERISLSGIAGKMVLTLQSSPAWRQQMQQTAVRTKYMQGTTRRLELSQADLERAESAVIEAITFIPAANLDEQVILQRFASPAQIISSSETTRHFLYPRIGLDLRLDSEGKEVLQYVAPRDFSRLQAPLEQSQ